MLRVKTYVAPSRVHGNGLFLDEPVSMGDLLYGYHGIDAAGIERPIDFINLTSNVSLVETQNAGNAFIVIRGITQARNSEPSVAVIVDGVQQVNPAQANALWNSRGWGTREEVRKRFHDVGVNAEVVHFDDVSGVMLCRFIDGGVTMNVERFKDLGSVKRAAVALKQVHDRGQPFLNRFELFQMIDEYLDILAKKDAPLPDSGRPLASL